MEEVVSILKNQEQIQELILKLKTMGEKSPEFQIFKKSIDLFHLNKTPKGVHQIDLLQNIFKFSDARNCFDSFRLVCKSWQNAVETIRLNQDPHLEILSEISSHESNGKFPIFFIKYIKIFKRFTLNFINLDVTKWDSISKFILQNVKNLRAIGIFWNPTTPPNLEIFLFNFFKNSQKTLQEVGFFGDTHSFTFPQIFLPNVDTVIILLHQVENFNFINTLANIMCKDMKQFIFMDIHRIPNVLEYIAKNYTKNFVYSPEISILEHIPLKVSHLKLEHLAHFRYALAIECLVLEVPNLAMPSDGEWDNYQNLLFFFPNLKSIVFFYKRKYTNLDSLLISLSSKNQNIWAQRISYFEAQKLKILSGKHFLDIKLKLKNESSTWNFEFRQLH